MHCPYCSFEDSKVTDSREASDGVRRRRECLRCGLRFTTYERVQTAALLVGKRDGRREEFSRDKLRKGLQMACTKRPLPLGTIEKMVEEIEGELQTIGRAEVLSAAIGELVMERLKSLDRVAYIRFSSVYRDFADIEHFKEAVEALEHTSNKGSENQPMLFPVESLPPKQRRVRTQSKFTTAKDRTKGS